MKLLAGLLCACASFAQPEWQFGGSIGYGAYRNASIYAPDGKLRAGVRNRFAAGFWVTEDSFEHISGELRYTYQDGDPFLAAGGTQTNVQGQSHAAHYDVLVHLRRLGSRVRPYLSFGAGVKVYRVTGPPNPSAPFASIGSLTGRDEAKFVAVPGAGVIVRVRPGLVMRFDLRDYITGFPKHLIAPVPLATARGFLQQITPLVSVGYSF